MTIWENKNIEAFDDERLIKCCIQGDEKALRVLYDRYNSSILNYLYRMVSDRTLAEDLTEETFFRVWRKARLFDERKGSFKTWLFRMASRLAINQFKKRARRDKLAAQVPLMEQEVKDDSLKPDEAADSSESCHLVQRALATLNEKDKSVLILRHFKGMGEGEVAEVLKIPRGTVKSRTYYAVKRLKVALENMGF